MVPANWPGYDRRKEIAWVKNQQRIKPTAVVKAYKRTLAERLGESRALLRRKVLVGDVHTHTTFSDGANTIPEIKEMGEAAGLDFVYITDHRTLKHRRYCREKGVWWGQEPPTSGREIVLLCPARLFVPRGKDLAGDFHLAESIAPFVFIPHPLGYGPRLRYSDEVVAAIRTLGERFSLELINGHGKLVRAYDPVYQATVPFWEDLLRSGKQVNVVGGSDAHISYTVGTVWTGVYGTDHKSAECVAKELAKGHTFASEAPLLWLGCARSIMGDALRVPKGRKLRISFVAVDSAGLHSVRLIRDGKIVRNLPAHDVARMAGVHDYTTTAKRTYFRLECTASDQRRAFSSPIYILPS